MSSLPDIKDLETLVEKTISILNEPDPPIQSYESPVSQAEQRAFFHQEKLRRMYELRGPFEQTRVFLQTNPKKGLFSDPYKKYKKSLNDYDMLLTSIQQVIEVDRKAIKTAKNQMESFRRQQASALSNTTLEHLRKVIKTNLNEQNRRSKASANAAAMLTRMSQEEANEARRRTAEREREVNENFDEMMNFYRGKKKGGRMTRKQMKRSKRTRKH